MPELILDKDKCLRNIERMAQTASKSQLIFRPHCKTHQSAEIANWFRDVGVSKITVSSFRMAAYFAAHGWEDILVAFPFNPSDLRELDRLTEKCRISVLTDNPDMLSFLERQKSRVDLYIDIDTGYGRTGIPSEDLQQLESIIRKSRISENLEFRGFYTHAGHSYLTSMQEERELIHLKAMKDLGRLKELFREYSPLALYGDTPNCSTQEDFRGIDGITPGNFVFYDLIQRSIGSCETGQIAVAMSCPVAGRYPGSRKLLIHGGAVHFSKETVEIGGRQVYGELAENTLEGWKAAVQPAFLTSISQEHGQLENCGALFDRVNLGEPVFILPPHSCLTANLMRNYKTLEGDIITTLNS